MRHRSPTADTPERAREGETRGRRRKARWVATVVLPEPARSATSANEQGARTSKNGRLKAKLYHQQAGGNARQSARKGSEAGDGRTLRNRDGGPRAKANQTVRNLRFARGVPAQARLPRLPLSHAGRRRDIARASSRWYDLADRLEYQIHSLSARHLDRRSFRPNAPRILWSTRDIERCRFRSADGGIDHAGLTAATKPYCNVTVTESPNILRHSGPERSRSGRQAKRKRSAPVSPVTPVTPVTPYSGTFTTKRGVSHGLAVCDAHTASLRPSPRSQACRKTGDGLSPPQQLVERAQERFAAARRNATASRLLLRVGGGLRFLLQHCLEFHLLGLGEVSGGDEALLVVVDADAQRLVALPYVFGADVFSIALQRLHVGG